MDCRSKNNGWQTFLEHWGFLLGAVLAGITFEVMEFFVNLSGTPWRSFLTASFVLLFSGAALIFYAKLPFYRSGRFLTFGIKSVPERLTGHYRWGWRVFLFGVVLSLCLLLSKP